MVKIINRRQLTDLIIEIRNWIALHACPILNLWVPIGGGGGGRMPFIIFIVLKYIIQWNKATNIRSKL